MDLHNVRIVSTKASRYFAEGIAERLGFGRTEPFIEIDEHFFQGGETYYRFEVDLRDALMGKDLILVGSTHTDAELLFMYRLGCAAAMYGARRRVFAIPFFGYSTMERAVKPGEIVTMKTNARMLSGIPNAHGGNAFLMFDLHVGGEVHYFEDSCLRFELYGETLLTEAIERLGLESMVMATADMGRPLWVKSLADHFEVATAYVEATRSHEAKRVDAVIGDVAGKNVVIYDDMTRSATTLINAAEAYVGRGASDVYAVLSHLALNGIDVAERLRDSLIRKVVATNSHPMSQAAASVSDKFLIVDAVPAFIDPIRSLLQ